MILVVGVHIGFERDIRCLIPEQSLFHVIPKQSSTVYNSSQLASFPFLPSLPIAADPLLFFFPPPSISKCPAFSAKDLSVFPINPAVYFCAEVISLCFASLPSHRFRTFVILCCLASTLFLGAIMRWPFFAPGAVDLNEDYIYQ